MDLGPISLARPGQVIAGRYKIERLLARGGSGAVFVAEQLTTDAKVALKLLLPHLLEAEGARKRFEFEARVAGRVQSEFIVRTIDAGVDEETSQPYLAMELLEGVSFAERARSLGPWSQAETALHMSQLASGLDKAHAHRTRDGSPAPIVHCDLKPENLFLAIREDGLPVTKILDFGVAKVVSDTLAITRGVVGSPLYIAYEQLTSGNLTPRTDIWAMGLIAFFMLTGRSYWRAASHKQVSVSAIFAEILSMPLISPTARAAELGFTPSWSSAFDEWFLRCVNRDPEARFASAGATAEALTEALLGPEGASGSFRTHVAPVQSPAGLETTTDRLIPVSSEPRVQRTFTSRSIARGAAGVAAMALISVAFLSRSDKPVVEDGVGIRSSRNAELDLPRTPPPPPPPLTPPPAPSVSAAPSASASAATVIQNASKRPVVRPKLVPSSSALDSPVYSER